MEIRPYRPEDEDPLRELAAALYREQFPDCPDSALDDAGLADHFEQILHIEASDAGSILIAEDSGSLIGFVCLMGVIKPKDLEEMDRPYAYLSDLYVSPDYRKQGIARRLAGAAEDKARAMGASRIALRVLSHNKGAIEFYRRCDYDDRFIVMAKALD